VKYLVSVFLLLSSSCASKSKVECRPRPPVLPEDPPIAAQCSSKKDTGVEHGVVFVYSQMPTDGPWVPELEPK
jgi:hypothetical protein